MFSTFSYAHYLARLSPRGLERLDPQRRTHIPHARRGIVSRRDAVEPVVPHGHGHEEAAELATKAKTTQDWWYSYLGQTA